MTTSLPTSKPPAEVHPMQALLDQGGYDMPQRGDIREGTVLTVTPQEVIIDLGLKREGIVPGNDLSRLEKETLEQVQEGTVWPVYILQTSDREGNLIVSISRAIQEKDWLVAQQMLDSNEIFEGTVAGHNNGGLEVIFGKLRGFVPASHISTLPRNATPEERKALLAAYVDQTIPLKVVEVDRRRRRLIMSERAAHRRWQREHRKQLLDEIEIGAVRTGIVRSLATFGAFVDLGGADGLIHISELAWFPVAHPSDVLKVGDKVEVKVLRVDRPRERVGLSLKRVQPDPWSHVQEDYKIGELVEAVVTRVTEFGAFVRLRSGVEGLLHVSEMADIRPDHPQSLVSPGDLLLLRVLRVEPQRRRIGLSLRQVSEVEWAEWAASYREKHAQAAEQAASAETEEVAAGHEYAEEIAAEAEAGKADEWAEVEPVSTEEAVVEAELAEAGERAEAEPVSTAEATVEAESAEADERVVVEPVSTEEAVVEAELGEAGERTEAEPVSTEEAVVEAELAEADERAVVEPVFAEEATVEAELAEPEVVLAAEETQGEAASPESEVTLATEAQDEAPDDAAASAGDLSSGAETPAAEAPAS